MNASVSRARKLHHALLLGAALAIASAVGPAPRSLAHGAASPASDGAFTAAQAARGKTVYQQQCASCHGASLEGQVGPALSGPTFQSSWKGRSVADLNDQIASSMPLTNPGSVQGQDLTDLLAYILSAQGAKPGNTELPAAHDGQTKIAIPGQ